MIVLDAEGKTKLCAGISFQVAAVYFCDRIPIYFAFTFLLANRTLSYTRVSSLSFKKVLSVVPVISIVGIVAT